MTEQELRLFDISHKAKMCLARKKELYKSVLYQRVGLGITPEDFDQVLNSLVAEGWCSLRQSNKEKRGPLIVFNEAFKGINL